MTVAFRIPEIETERLRLRLPKASDLDAHIAFRASERSKGVGGPYDAPSSFHHLEGIIGQWQLRGYGRWMVADKDTDAPLGVVGIYHPMDWPEAEIGWSLYEAGEGRGIAAEAARATRDYAYRTLGWDRIVSLIMPDNDRSIRLAERLGCTNEKPFVHPVFGTLDIWVHPAPEALQ
ncbi:GNAT family N-acetyltransferase [Alphaproteobacteria bacterium GH1-50]|uniref:GNAT family N-acetyltransferase n=1 Tax=Kangsaoukella pontilimi TaxID=2691042 RepID=A0A7C9IQP1_9RHOB|nr:GNAT family N-acetyltransferase [Kangsaoukella pontilimi]MXQ09490.1 GNAT family N-acetyltransferase [Kangsaoukella pontilimi]